MFLLPAHLAGTWSTVLPSLTPLPPVRLMSHAYGLSSTTSGGNRDIETAGSERYGLLRQVGGLHFATMIRANLGYSIFISIP